MGFHAPQLQLMSSQSRPAQADALPTAGLAGFYNGLRAKIVQSVLAAAILFYIREEVYLAVRPKSPLPALLSTR